MITRILEIRGVGSLKNVRPDKGHECSFARHTVVYAPNATGKTTLAAVLKAYGFDDPVLIGSRTTLSGGATPFAIIELDGRARRFQNGSWYGRQDAEYPFAVFDHAFIEDNVFASEVTPDHLKSIHRIVIGTTGKALNDTLERCKQAEKEVRRDFQALQKDLGNLQTTTGRQDYLDLPRSLTRTDAEARTNEYAGRLKALKDVAAVATLAVPSLQPLRLGDFAALRRVATASVAVVHADAKERVKQRIQTVLRADREAESFLNIGHRLRPPDGQCPFCGQNTKPVVRLLDDYEKCFDKSFAELKDNVTERVKRFAEWSPAKDLQAWMATAANAATLREKWVGLISDLPPLPDVGAFIEEAAATAVAHHAKAREELEKKTLSLDAKPDLAHLDDLEGLLRRVRAETERCVQACEQIGARIAEFRQKLKQSNAEDTERELARRRAIVEGLSPPADIWRKRFREAEALLTAREKERESAEKVLEAYCRETYAEFQNGVNHFLSGFDLRLTVSGLEPRSTKQSNQVLADISFGVDGCAVSASKRQSNDPCFKNTLSEGEKSALAFAFFLADLRRRDDLSNAIVILDDPLSSFDDGRREETANILARLSEKCRQVIVLTHRTDFVVRLFEQPSFDGRFLRLAADAAQGVRIEPLDVKDLQQQPHEKNVRALVSFAETGVPPARDNLPRLVRCVLEFALAAKYLVRLHRGERDLTAMHNRLRADGLLGQEVDAELTYLNSRSQEGLHAATSHDPTHALSDTEYRRLAKRTLDLLEKI